MSHGEDLAPSALTDPGSAIQESAEAALIRGMDAEDAVREGTALAVDAVRRTGTQIDVLSRLQEDPVVSAFMETFYSSGTTSP